MFGDIYDQFRGKAKEAFGFLISRKSGDLTGVFHRDEIGDIDLVWGDKDGGLEHILDKHVGMGKSFATIEEFVNAINEVVTNGNLENDTIDKAVFKIGSRLVTIRKNFREDGKKKADKNWVLTAYDESAADDGTSAMAVTNRVQAAPDTANSGAKVEKVSESEKDISEKKTRKRSTGFTSAKKHLPTTEELFAKDKEIFGEHNNWYGRVIAESNSVEEAIAKLRQMQNEQKSIADDWRSRKYKSNNGKVLVGGKQNMTDDFAVTTISAANERRRNAAIRNAENFIKEIEDAIAALKQRAKYAMADSPAEQPADRGAGTEANAQRQGVGEPQADPKPIGRGVFGDIYDQFRGKAKEAFGFLISRKSGDLTGVFHRNEIGDIDLVWGDGNGGLEHILDKHVGNGKSFASTEEAVEAIDDIIKNGKVTFENGDKIALNVGSKTVTIRKNFREKGKKIADKNWVLTAYDEMAADGDNSAITTGNQAKAALSTTKSSAKIEKVSESENKKPRKHSKGFAGAKKPIPITEDLFAKEKEIFGEHNDWYGRVIAESNSVEEAIAKLRQMQNEQKSIADDWRSRKYKSNNGKVLVGGKQNMTDDFAVTTISAANERRRNAAIRNAENFIKEIEDAIAALKQRTKYAMADSPAEQPADRGAGTEANAQRQGVENNPQPTIDNRYSIPIEIANNEAELASVSQDALQKSKEDILVGFYNPKTSRVFFYMPGVEEYARQNGLTVQEVMDAKFMHEVLAHKGLAELFGERKGDFYKAIWKGMSKNSRENWATYAWNWETDKDKRKEIAGADKLWSELTDEQKAKVMESEHVIERAADEYIADLSERISLKDVKKINVSAWRKVSNSIKDMFNKIFGTKFVTEKAIRGNIADAAKIASMITEDESLLADVLNVAYQNLRNTSNLQNQVGESVLPTRGERIVGEIVTEIAKESTEVVTDKAEMQRVLNEEVEKMQKDAVEATNNTFNKQLDGLTENNADSVRLELGMPSAVLLSSGIANKPMLLYGNKVIKKAKKHGFSPKDLKDLPKAVQSPIAVFDGSKHGSFAILTEIKIDGKNMLVSLTLSREGNVDLNIITSAYGKNTPSVINWINSGKLRYAYKQKALDYISTSAPIADATNNQEPYNSAAKVVENFENPKISADILQKMTVWHGSPYAFDAFDHSKVGTGEGAQAHGWGTYVVKDEETGKRYAETLGKGGCRASVVCREGKEYARENVGCHKAMACQQQRV